MSKLVNILKNISKNNFDELFNLTGLTLTCLREWYCSPNTGQNNRISCGCFNIVSSDSSQLASRRNPQARRASTRAQEADPPTYASLNYIVNSADPLASQASFFKVTLESNCGSVENESNEEEKSPPTYNEVLKIKSSSSEEPFDSGRGVESENVAGSSSTPQYRPGRPNLNVANSSRW